MEFRISTSDVKELFALAKLPKIKPKFIILFIHGLGEHIGRYEDWWNKLSEYGIAVIGVDLPGHGKSSGRRGHIKNYQVYNGIINELYSNAIRIIPNTPIGIYGHSMGGNIALNYLLTNTYELEFAIISSPWLILEKPPPKFVEACARAVNLFFPSLLLKKQINHNLICKVDEVNQKYQNDPLVHGKISIRLALEATDAALRILETGYNIEIPIFIVHGFDDEICSPKGSKKFAAGKDNVDLEIFKDGYHELHNEVFKNDVYKSITDWLNKLY